MALEFEEKMRRIAMEDCPDRIFIEASGFGKLSDVVKVCTQLKEKEHLEMGDRTECYSCRHWDGGGIRLRTWENFM